MSFKIEPVVDLKITLELTAEEAAACAVMGSYGIDKFVEFFHNNLGKTYMEPYQKGLRSFLEKTQRFESHYKVMKQARAGLLSSLHQLGPS